MIRWEDPGLTSFFGASYLGLLTLLWAGLTLGISTWGRRWRLQQRPGSPSALPEVSVCIPARNEADNIGPCVRSVLASRGVDLELLILDDQSTDQTTAAARRAGEGDRRLRILKGAPLPPGWAGKPWAISQAAANARYQRLLFLDADVELHPDAIRSALYELERRGLDILSVFGSWRLESFWERVVIPPVGWLVRGAVDLDAVNDPARPAAFANGQFIMVKREPYEAMRGHGAVRDEVLEDVRLAEAMKRVACPTGLLFGPWAFRVRLYRSFSEILAGYTKNFYEGMGRQPMVALGLVLFIIVGTLLPFGVLFGAPLMWWLAGWRLLGPAWMLWVAGVCLLILGFRWRQEAVDGRAGWYALTHPLGNAILAFIALRSMLAVDVEWKGRPFQDGKARGT